MRVFILNGPPGIGKDTLAANIERVFNFPVAMFKTALYEATAKFFFVGLSWFVELATGRDTKEVPHMALDGLSPRQALIHVSEKVIKPTKGKRFFGNKAVEFLHANRFGQTGNYVFSDGGFPEECGCLVDAGHDVHIIQLHHPEFDFSKDSRNYVDVPGATVHKIDVVMGQPMMDVSNFINIVGSLDQ